LSDFRPLAERTLHAWGVWSLVEGEFGAPGGEPFTRTFVRSPGAVGVVPLVFDAEGNASVVLVRQYRAALDRAMDEIPAGMRDVDGEPPEETAARELIEETGLRAGRIELLTRFHNSSGLTNAETHVFLATDLVEAAHDRQGPEEQAMTVRHVPLVDAVAAVLRGELTDAKTVTGLLLTERLLARREGR
jgi:8-oxo-dGTP pyrophosphatase MutT (NUDIX family)